jgi:hypothetical protein
MGATAPHTSLWEGFGITHYQCARKHNVCAQKAQFLFTEGAVLRSQPSGNAQLELKYIRLNGLEHLLDTNHD